MNFLTLIIIAPRRYPVKINSLYLNKTSRLYTENVYNRTGSSTKNTSFQLVWN